MNTKILYFIDAYQKTASAKVVEVLHDGNQTGLILDQTIFYAQGGGQPADQGSIMGEKSAFTVTHVSYNGGAILHKGKLSGEIAVGDKVTLEVDWRRRYQHMQQHTAGHILDQAVKNVVPSAKSVDGNHGIGKQCYVEFETELVPALVPQIQKQIQDIVRYNLPITTEMVTYDELIKRGIKLPFDLPKNKDLRIVQIGEYPAMPDGGTQLKTTGEAWPIAVTGITLHEGRWRVLYEVKKETQEVAKLPIVQEILSPTQTTTLQELQTKIAELKQQFGSEKLTSEELHTKYLGKKGLFNQLAQVLKTIDPAVKREAGQLLNFCKTFLETELQQRQTNTNETLWTDLTIPGIQPKIGHMHPISQAMEEITHIFEQIGFTRARYPEVDWDHYVFEALNMPPNHPARDEWETFFIDAPSNSQLGKIVLTTHTSNGWLHEMERVKSQPPIRMINIGRCYRRQQDATHTQMFHQFEGLVVDKGINIQHLKGTLNYFAQQFYGPETKSRIRPFHFQFTEPSFEVDFSCHICHGTGKVTDPETNEKVKCKFCKSGWHEVGGAGMVHPNVLRAGGIDPDEYTGFAFGWGIERTYTLREGLNIDDIRLLYSGDLRFLEQF